MRKMEICEGFCLTGTIPGASKPDVVKEVTLPFALQSAQEICGQEGLFLRSWDLYAMLTKPEEPAHSHAERTLLTLDGVTGEGYVKIGKCICKPIKPHMVLDVTEALRSGSVQLHLHLLPQHPLLLDGEYGNDLIATGGLFSAELRNIYHMRIDSIDIDVLGNVQIRIHAYGAGKIRLCLRFMLGDELIWSQNSAVYLQVGDQVIERKLETEKLIRGAVLRVAADMGGEACDSSEAVYSDASAAPASNAHFRKLPSEKMLGLIRDAGFDGAVFYEYPHIELQNACKRLGLAYVWKKKGIELDHIVKTDAEYDLDKNGCLAIPSVTDDDRSGFLRAQRLSEAVLTKRAEGKLCDVLAWCRQTDAQDGLFDAKGEPAAALYAVKNALSKYTVWTPGKKKLYHPYEEFCEKILLMCSEPDQKPAAIQVQLYAWDGKEIACRVFPLCIRQKVQHVGEFRARLPLKELSGIVLRLQCIRDGRLLSVDHVYYPCADESGERISFPDADLTECAGGDLYNAGDAVAMGVNIVCSGKNLLSFGAILPQERIALANSAQTMVKYGNPIMKGGRKSVAQRILRGVFSDRYAASIDP